MLRAIRVEWMKAHWDLMLIIIFIGTFLSAWNAYSMLSHDVTLFDIPNEWLLILSLINNTYSIFLLPIMGGVLAGIVSQTDHAHGGWKQIHTLPIAKWNWYIAKFAILFISLIIAMLFVLGAIVGIGWMADTKDAFPWSELLNILSFGFVALIPLVALQLWTSLIWRSFAAGLILNVVATIPSIIVAQSSYIGPYYPWSQVFLMMNPMLEVSGGDQFVPVLIISFLLFFVGGLVHFVRRDVV